MVVTGELRDRYQKSKKKEKITILNEFTKLTGYNRCYASQILNHSKLLGYVHIAEQTIKYIRDHKKRRKKKKYYDHDVSIALKKLWEGADFIGDPASLRWI